MIRAIGSSIKTFKPITFMPGLNILLAERDVASTDTDTRNGSGKSSVVQIIHFLLGGSKTEESFLRFKEVAHEAFWGEFEFSGIPVRVRRDVNKPGVVHVTFPNGIPDGIDVRTDLYGQSTMEVTEWTRWLGHVVFGLPLKRDRKPFNDPHAPTFRKMIGYFARRREEGGFLKPHLYYRTQHENEAKIALSYLFDLDWALMLEFEHAREDRNRLKDERKRLTAKLDPKANTVARIINAKAEAEADAVRLRADVSNFQVEQHFEELVEEADEQKAVLEKLARESAKLTTSLRHLNESLTSETPAKSDALERLYKEAGFNLPGSVAKRFEDVKVFQESVLNNRRIHLADELERIQARLAEIKSEKADAARRRSEILIRLQGKGAFSDLADLTGRLAQKEETLARLESQLDDALLLQKGSTTLKSRETNLLSRLQNDLAARTDTISLAVNAVREARTALYADRWGTFEINPRPKGPEFRVEIESGTSGGIASMEIFCMDYALYKLVTPRLGGPGFLIHDSHLFDPVDSRQKAMALELGASLTAAVGGQYIAMLNSDELEKLEFSPGFNARSHVLPTVLKDTDDGGLFGFRFG